MIDLTKLADEEMGAIENGTFFNRLKAVDTTRDYSIIVDMSGSMGFTDSTTGGKTRWKAPLLRRRPLRSSPLQRSSAIPTVSLCIFFYSSIEKFENVKSPEDVRAKFKNRGPWGSTAVLGGQPPYTNRLPTLSWRTLLLRP